MWKRRSATYKYIFIGKYFLYPTGKSGRCFIDETTRLIDVWVRGSPLKNITLKAVMIMPSRLLLKPRKGTKTKDHTKALERRLKLWTDGHLAQLLKGRETKLSSLKQVNAPKIFAQLLKYFVQKMQKGNVDSAIKLITNNMQNGILPLTDTTLKLLNKRILSLFLQLKKSFYYN